MKRFERDRYGSPAVLHLADVPAPEPTAGQVLVRVRAVSLNAHDWHMLRGKPYIARLSEGLRRPANPSLGVDLAGTVEAVGEAVSELAVGDEVIGCRFGAYAELVAAGRVVRKPRSLSWDEAAALPTAGMTALQGLRDHGRLQAGERVLVMGAGGGVGTFAVQIAASLGADVTAVSRAANRDTLLAIGATDVVDHHHGDALRAAGRFDLVLDVAGTTSVARLRRLLTPTGRIVMVAPGSGQWIGPIARVVAAAATTRLGRAPARAFLAEVRTEDMATLADLAAAGTIRPVIADRIGFEEIPAGIRRLEAGGVCGKIVATLPTD